MFETIYNVVSKKNIALHKDNSFFKILHKSNGSKLFLNEVNNDVFKKSIDFYCILNKKQKDDNTSITYFNFFMYNGLNILNKQKIMLYFDDMKNINEISVKKKKIDTFNTNLVHRSNVLNQLKFLSIEKNKHKIKILKKKPFLKQFVKQHNTFFQRNKIQNIKIAKNLDKHPFNIQKLKNHINFLDSHTNTSKSLHNEKNMMFLTYSKSYKDNVFFYNNLNKNPNIINSAISENNVFRDSKNFNDTKSIKVNNNSVMMEDSLNSIKWKKIINEKILFLLSNKNNQAEINLKPDYLGPIYITINMNNRNVKLNFISHNHETCMFLDNYIPILRNSLIKNGITLEKFNISSEFKNKELKNYKKIENSKKFPITYNIRKKNLEILNDKPIDIYV